MRLILKRYEGLAGKPWTLHSSDGEVVEGVISTVLSSSNKGHPILTVEFECNGRDILIEGDKNVSI